MPWILLHRSDRSCLIKRRLAPRQKQKVTCLAGGWNKINHVNLKQLLETMIFLKNDQIMKLIKMEVKHWMACLWGCDHASHIHYCLQVEEAVWKSHLPSHENCSYSSLLPEFLKKANVVATCRSEINLCEPTERKSRIVYARVGKRQYIKGGNRKMQEFHKRQ